MGFTGVSDNDKSIRMLANLGGFVLSFSIFGNKQVAVSGLPQFACDSCVITSPFSAVCFVVNNPEFVSFVPITLLFTLETTMELPGFVTLYQQFVLFMSGR
jgi:hypothetical protein